MYLIPQSGQIKDQSDEKVMSKMMKGFRKIIAKDMSENGHYVIKGKKTYVLQLLSTNMQTSDRRWFT